jgi:O-antigen/teichoic acid export membrane protein
LYTRTLSRSDFGTYIIVKTNSELFTYVLYFGLPSAVARLYFDYRNTRRHFDYMSSITSFFLINLLVFGAICALWGPKIWSALSPETPPMPYLWFSIAIAAAGFFASLGPLWLRLEERVHAFVSAQFSTAVVLVVAAFVALVILHLGLGGLVGAIVLSSGCSALVLPWLFGRRFRPAIEYRHISESLAFGVPIMLGYVAYFVLNRTGTVILQRYVPSSEIAVFGLAQQLAMVVTVAGVAFGKALQPAVFSADASAAMEVLERMGLLFILTMFCTTATVFLFASEILSFVAPQGYQAAYGILLIIGWANLAYSLNLISGTVLLYERRPKTSVTVSTLGAVCSAALGLWLIPLSGLRGAAIATAFAFFIMTLSGQCAARRITGRSQLGPIMLALAAAGLVAALAAWLRQQSLPVLPMLGLKGGIAAIVCTAAYLLVRLQERPKACVL